MSTLLNVFSDIGGILSENLGDIGITLLIVMLSMMALLLLSNIIVAAAKLKNPKLVFKWGQFIILVVLVLLIVWLCTTGYPN